MKTLCWILVLIALGAVGFGEYRVHAEAETFPARLDAALKNKEEGYRRAAKQDFKWIADQATEQLETSSQQYQALMREFSDYQNDHDCRAKK